MGRKLTTDTVFISMGHLYNAMDLLTVVNNSIVENPVIDMFDLAKKLEAGWLEVNKCRLYTEDVVDFEEYLVPSMGLINDAKCMLESLVAWNLGMTLYGKHNILRCIREAGLGNISPVIDELEALFVYLKENEEVEEESFIQCVAF